MSKYKAVKKTIDGITFDSTVEAEYYEFLKFQQASGYIECFDLQPKFILWDSFVRDDRRYTNIIYKADFEVFLLDGTSLVVDIKGVATPLAKLKRKMFLDKFREKKLIWLVKSKKYSKDGSGFADYDFVERERRLAKRGKILC